MVWVAIGLTLATFAYSLYMQSKMVQPQQPLQGFTMPTAAEGIAIPVVFGTREVTAPNACWFGNTKVIDYTNYGGKNSGYGYFAGLQFGVCHGKIDALLDIKIAGKTYLFYPITANTSDGGILIKSYEDDVGQPNQDVYSGGIIVKMGAANSLPDAGQIDYLAGAMSLSPGPSYHGVATVVARGDSSHLGASPYLKPWTFTVKRLHTRNGGADVQWYDEKVEVKPAAKNREDTWKYKVKGDWTDYSSPSYDDSAWDTGPGGIGNADPNTLLSAKNEARNSFGIGPWPDYSIPVTKTQLPVDGDAVKAGNPHHQVPEGANLWLRTNMGPLPAYPLNFRCWHDDSGKLWFNGNEITLVPVVNPSYTTDHFSSIGTIPKEYINVDGPNDVAYRVTNGFDSSGTVQLSSNSPPSFISAGLQIGAESDVDTPAGVVDMNFAHIAREAITDTFWGMGYPEATIDDASFRAAADTLYTEGLGGSFTWTQQMTIEDFLTDIMRHISGALYIDRHTGLWTLKLIRADYTIGDLLVLDESNVSKIENATRKQPGELVNSVTVTYSSTLRGDQGAVTLEDQGGIAAQGGVVSAKINYPAITNPVNASKLSLRDLRLVSSPLLSCVVHAGRAAAALNISDPFVLNWPDLSINSVVMRVSEIDTGTLTNGEVKVTCIEDLFYFPSQAISIPNDPIPRNPTRSPGTAVAADDYVTAYVIDPRDKGSVEFMFGETALATPNSPFEDSSSHRGWTSGPDGTMTCNTVGGLLARLVDGVSDGYPATGIPNYVSWLVSRRVLVAKVNTSYPTYDEQEKTGVYVIDDVGWHNDETGAFVATFARMHRDPDYDQSSEFVKDMVFRVNAGTTYGGHFVQLNTDGAVLGITPLAWVDHGTSFTFTNGFDLLRSDQLATVSTSPDSMLVTSLTEIGGTLQVFTTTDGVPNVTSIPAGPWTVTPSIASMSGASSGSVTTVGFKLYKGGTALFELLSGPLEVGPQVIPPLTYSAPQYALAKTDGIALLISLHTNSTTPVTLMLEYNAANAIGVRVPKAPVGQVVVELGSTASAHISISEMAFDQGPQHAIVVGAAGNRTPAIQFPSGHLSSIACMWTVPNDAGPDDIIIRPIFTVPSTVSGQVMWMASISEQSAIDVSVPGFPWLGITGSKVANKSVLETGSAIGSFPPGTRLRIGLWRNVTGDTLASAVDLLGIQLDYSVA